MGKETVVTCLKVFQVTEPYYENFNNIKRYADLDLNLAHFKYGKEAFV
jgi:hypothetical protein